jgi:hypothetical protein
MPSSSTGYILGGIGFGMDLFPDESLTLRDRVFMIIGFSLFEAVEFLGLSSLYGFLM